jgi:ABC-type oligopeptide transport system substrate-binding subunit
MKRIILFLFILSLLSTIGFTQGAAAQKKSTASSSKKANEFILTGYIDEIQEADPSLGEKSKIIIAAKNGSGIVFFVKKTTTIYDKDMNAIKLGQIPLKASVRIRYRTDRDGFLEALSITRIEN